MDQLFYAESLIKTLGMIWFIAGPQVLMCFRARAEHGLVSSFPSALENF